jgi:hypothetical protein
MTDTDGTAVVRRADIAFLLCFDTTVFTELVLLMAAEEARLRVARLAAGLRLDPIAERCRPAAALRIRHRPADLSAAFHRCPRSWTQL